MVGCVSVGRTLAAPVALFAMAPAMSPGSTFRDDLLGWENDFDRAVVPPNREAEWKPKNPPWDATLRDAVNHGAGFEWEDQLAVGAEQILMSPTRMTRALGKVLQRGYDQRRAVPLAEDLARVPSPNRPAWSGLGCVPKNQAPKRETDWWAPGELDLNGNHQEHGRLGSTYADGTKPVPSIHHVNDSKNKGVHPGVGGFFSPKKHLGKNWIGKDPYRTKNERYARIPGEEKWWHPRELGMGEWDGDVDGEIATWSSSDESDDSDASGESDDSDGSYDSHNEDADGSTERRNVRQEKRRDARRQERREQRQNDRRNARFAAERQALENRRDENGDVAFGGGGGGIDSRNGGLNAGGNGVNGWGRLGMSGNGGHPVGREDGTGRGMRGACDGNGGRARLRNYASGMTVTASGGIAGGVSGGTPGDPLSLKQTASGREMGTDPENVEPEPKKKKKWLLCC